MLDINWNPSRRDLRQFAGIWLPLFGALAGTAAYRAGAVTAAVAVWVIAAAIGAIGVVWPQRIKPLFVGWMAAAYPIGWTVSHVVLAVVYFGLFTIVALLMRLVRYDPLDRAGSRATYWKPRAGRTEAAAYFRQS